MDRYRPFLLPLLEAAAAGPRGRRLPQADSPLEEERALDAVDGEEAEIWNFLKAAAEATYGLPLLTSCCGSGRARPHPAWPAATSPDRCLVLEDGPATWFLIEQPAAIPLIDRFSEPGQRAAIARPSLFSRLWREQELTRGEAQPHAGCNAVRSEDRAQAVNRHIARLVDGGRPSDWHLEPTRDHYRSRLRVDGSLQRAETLPLAKGQWLLNSIIALAGIQDQPGQAMEGRLIHKAPAGDTVTLRISLVPSQFGLSMVIRFLYPGARSRLSLDAIGLGEQQLETICRRYRKGEGLWLVVGPTGSGKSTTLNAFLQLSVQAQEKVLSIEDPVEYTLPGVHHLSLGSPPGLTWERAVRAFLRQAPDCVLVGEIRDEATAAIVLQAARTGHRILSTLHARDNAGVRRRFADLGQDPEYLESVCELVLHQRLVPLLCRQCIELTPFPADWTNVLEESGLPSPLALAAAPGCAHCCSGWAGRQAVFSSGNIASRVSVSAELKRAAWQLLLENRTALAATLPFLPATLRTRFGICQV